MLPWTQVLSWTLICSLGQGFVVYGSLWLILKLVPASASGMRYRLSLSALLILLLWSGLTLWQEFNAFVALNNATADSTGRTVFYVTQQRITGPAGVSGMASWAQTFSYGLAVAYLSGLLFMLARLSAGFAQLFYIRRTGLEQPSKALRELLAASKIKLKLTRPVQLFITAKSQIPMVIGFIKPVIVLPAATMMQLSPEQLETILLHELAHIKRNDFLVNVLQTIVETILFFNPFVWLTSAIIRREREHCCDDLVLAHISEPVYYARALSALAGQYGNDMAVAATGQPYHLLHRITRIMELKKSPFNYSRIAAAILTVMLIVVTAIRFSPSFAIVKKNESGALLTLQHGASAAAETEEAILVRQLSNDHLINEAKGFVIEKKEGKLFIDYKVVADGIARKYLSDTRKKEMLIQVYPLQERIKRHPGSSLLQLAAPVQMSSPCVDYKASKKEGC